MNIVLSRYEYNRIQQGYLLRALSKGRFLLSEIEVLCELLHDKQGKRSMNDIRTLIDSMRG